MIEENKKKEIEKRNSREYASSLIARLQYGLDRSKRDLFVGIVMPAARGREELQLIDDRLADRYDEFYCYAAMI